MYDITFGLGDIYHVELYNIQTCLMKNQGASNNILTCSYFRTSDDYRHFSETRAPSIEKAIPVLFGEFV